MATPRKLNLEILSNGIPAITPNMGICLVEAISVCLENQLHGSSAKLDVDVKIDTEQQLTFQIERLAVSDQMRRAWGDMEYTTEQAAYGLAALLIRELTDFTLIERAKKGPGFDYWLGYEGDFLFQRKARLEVSGILKGKASDIKRRVKIKLAQTNPSDGGRLPAFIVVSEFSRPAAQVVKK